MAVWCSLPRWLLSPLGIPQLPPCHWPHLIQPNKSCSNILYSNIFSLAFIAVPNIYFCRSPAKLGEGQLHFCLMGTGNKPNPDICPPAWAVPACTDDVVIIASFFVKIMTNVLFSHSMSIYHISAFLSFSLSQDWLEKIYLLMSFACPCYLISHRSRVHN